MGSLRVVGVVIGVGGLLLAACGVAPSGPAAGTFTPAVPGVLTVATNLPAPGFWEGPAAAPTGGFEYALAHELAERFDLGEVRAVDVAFADLVAGDLHGADLALAELTPTAARDEQLDFSTAYLDAHPAVLVQDGLDVPDLAAARDLRWAVQTGSTHVDLVTERIRPDAELITGDDIAAVVDAVATGTVDAALLDLPTAIVQEQLTDGRLRVVAQFATDDAIAAAVPEGSDNLEAIDSAIRAMLRDGTVDRLAEDWLGRAASDGAVDIPLIRAQPVAP